MQASISDLKYKMREVLKALARNQKVTILNRGKKAGYIIPANDDNGQKVEDHPFFGMNKSQETSVNQVMEKLRGGRYNAL